MEKMQGAVKNSLGGVSVTAREIEFGTTEDIFKEAGMAPPDEDMEKLDINNLPDSSKLKPVFATQLPKKAGLVTPQKKETPKMTQSIAQPFQAQPVAQPTPPAPAPATQPQVDQDPLMVLGELFPNAPSPEQIH